MESHRRPNSSPNCVARALYENVAETADELGFRRGDVLTVLEQNAGGLEGWWLCSLRGRQGIAPANRLRLLPGLSDPTGLGYAGSSPALNARPPPPDTLSALLADDSRRRSWHTGVGGGGGAGGRANGAAVSGEYDIPVTSRQRSPSDSYDTPPAPRALPKPFSGRSASAELLNSYDVPNARPPTPPARDASSSSSSSLSSDRSSLDASLSALSSFGSNRSSVERDVYDIPPEPRPLSDADCLQAVPRPPNASGHILLFYDIPVNNTPVSRPAYDIPRSSPLESSQDVVDSAVDDSIADYSVAPPLVSRRYSADEALAQLVALQREVESPIGELLAFVTGTTWRSRLSGRVAALRVSCRGLRDALKRLLMFGYEALAASNYASDKTLSLKLCKLLNQLGDANAIVDCAVAAIDADHWSPRGDESAPAAVDHLDRLVACCRGLGEDVKHVSSFIRGNIRLIFAESPKPPIAPKPKLATPPPPLPPAPHAPPLPPPPKNSVQCRPLPPVPAVERNSDSNSDNDCDYDYVSLESKECVEKQNQNLKNLLPKELLKSFDDMLRDADIPVQRNQNRTANDRQVLAFYSLEMERHAASLTTAIEAFVRAVRHSQPPHVFVSHSKFVVIAGQKLTYIGDTVTRNVSQQSVRAAVAKSADTLADAIGALVLSTKRAALAFPSVSAVQQMVDSVGEVSRLATELRLAVSGSV